MPSILTDTLAELDRARARSGSAILVAFSGGKDSLVCLDLCVRSFSRVECFFMYLVPGLECVETMLQRARDRWGVTIRQYPHWVLSRLIRDGIYSDPWFGNDDLPRWTVREVYELAMAESGIRFVATGAKLSDSMWRRRNMMTAKRIADFTINPLKRWSKLDVLAYLHSHAIPVPDGPSGNATGIDLSTPSLLWLHDHHPADFARVCEVFPYAEAVVWRRKFYG